MMSLHGVALGLALFAQTQTGPAQDFQQLLQEYQQALAAEQAASEATSMRRETATASAAGRLNTPASRAALWQTVNNTSLPAEVRLAAIDALRRMGDVSNFEQLVNSLAQLRTTGEGIASRIDAEEASLKRHREEPRVTIESVPREFSPRAHAASPHAGSRENDTIYKRNLIFGGIAVVLAVALLILRKRP